MMQLVQVNPESLLLLVHAVVQMLHSAKTKPVNLLKAASIVGQAQVVMASEAQQFSCCSPTFAPSAITST